VTVEEARLPIEQRREDDNKQCPRGFSSD